jgi:hypothetical protein
MLPRLGASFQQGVKMGGCSKFLLWIVGIIFLLFALANPTLWIVVVVGVAGGIIAQVLKNRADKAEFLAGMETQANILEELVKGRLVPSSLAMSLAKDELPVCVLPSVALTEYESTGSSFSGGTAGVSFPLTDTIRGNVGGMKGSFTKNPEQLMIVDKGQAIFTNQRIIFSGAKFVRDWNLKDTVSLEPGPNGFDVKVAVTNRERTSGLRSLDYVSFGPGYAAAYVFNLSQNGKEAADKWASELVQEIRTTVAAERIKGSK